MSKPPQDDRAGILYAALAYAIWGVVPVYWHELSDISSLAITCWRVVFSTLFALAIIAWRGRLAHLSAILAAPPLLARLALSSVLIAGNWLLFIYSVNSHQLVESSLGYFMLPLISIVMGVGLLGETLSRLRFAALVLVAAAIAMQALAAGHVPWIALGLALSFGFYGYLRKLIVVGPLEGLFVETALLLPFAAGFLAWRAWHGEFAFWSATVWHDLLLLATGPVTAVPLALFSAGARRIRLSTLGFLQYLSPSISLVIAVAVYGEPFGAVAAATFGCVWLGLLLVAGESQFNRLRLSALGLR